MKNKGKERLFEVMSKLDKTFKPKMNEMNSAFYNDDESNQTNETNIDVNDMLNSYFETALWAEGGDGNELDGKTIYDFDDSVKRVSLNDIQKFIQLAQQQAPEELADYDSKRLGHNLWLSRNGHGAGFFDDNNDTLQNIAIAMKSADIYVGDDGKVYIMGAESNNENLSLNNIGESIQKINPKYTHFAVYKDTNKIVIGWDYNGFDGDELRQFKKDYFIADILDMDIRPTQVTVLTTNFLKRKGINPYDANNWTLPTN